MGWNCRLIIVHLQEQLHIKIYNQFGILLTQNFGWKKKSRELKAFDWLMLSVVNHELSCPCTVNRYHPTPLWAHWVLGVPHQWYLCRPQVRSELFHHPSTRGFLSKLLHTGHFSSSIHANEINRKG